MTATSPGPAPRHSRRSLLKLGLAGTLGLGAGLVCAPHIGRASLHEKRVGLVNLHTGERIDAVYWADGSLVEEALQRIDRVMRDHRSNEIAEIDPRLIEKLWSLREAVETTRAFELISGYRSAASNAKLKATTEGVAENSFHVRGQAADLRLPGVDLLRLRRAARAMDSGGVGYYPFSDFLHIDSGPTRFW